MSTKWKVFEKSGGRSSRYIKYFDKIAVIISSDRGMILTPPLIDLLGKPNRVLLLTDSNGNIGINPVKDNDPQSINAFAIQYPRSKNPTGTAMCFVNCKRFLLGMKLNLKAVYDQIYVDNDIIVIDTSKYKPLSLIT